MDTFQITVLSIATIVLFGILIVVGMLMRKEGKSVPFPPVSTDCPDGWTQNGKMCIPDASNKGIFTNATNTNIITDFFNSSDKKTSKEFKIYTPGFAFCKTNKNLFGSSPLTDANCNTLTGASKQECLRCLSIPSDKRNEDGIVMTDELWSAGGKSARCAKKAWANRFGFNWDGVSNYNSCN